MTTKAALLLILVGTVSTFVQAQGPACSQYNAWAVTGFAGYGSAPDYSWASPIIAANEAAYGGAGPICTTSWYTEAPPGNWTFACYATTWSCKPTSPPVGGCSEPTCGEPISLANGNVSIQRVVTLTFHLVQNIGQVRRRDSFRGGRLFTSPENPMHSEGAIRRSGCTSISLVIP